MSQACASSNHGSWKHITVPTTMTYAASTMQCRRCGESQCRIASHRVLLSVAATVAELMFPVSRCVRNTQRLLRDFAIIAWPRMDHGGSVIFHVAEPSMSDAWAHHRASCAGHPLERLARAAELLELLAYLHLHQRVLACDPHGSLLHQSRQYPDSSVRMPSFSPDCSTVRILTRLATANQRGDAEALLTHHAELR